MDGWLSRSAGSFRLAFAEPGLARLQTAWAACITGEQCFEIALAVFAYERGGITAAGLLALVRAAVSAATAPFTAGLGDRFPRRSVLVASAAAMAVIAAGISAAAGAGLTDAVYGLALVYAVAVPAYRPVQSALLPGLARTPEQLTASNVVVSLLEGLGNLVGPVIAGVLLATSGAAAAFAAVAVLLAGCTAAAWLVPAPAEAPADPGSAQPHAPLAGLREAVRNPAVRTLVGLYTVSMLVWGAFFQVLVVVIAVERLDIGQGGAGALAAATGIGALVAGAVAVALIGRRRLAPALAVGVACWTLPLAAMAVTHSPGLATAAATLIGAGVVLIDVAVFTLLQRAAPDDVLARVFGVLESAMRAALGIGAVAVPLLVSGLGLRAALLLVAAVQPVALVFAWRSLRGVDALDVLPAERLALLRQAALFARLPALPLERLAARMAPREVAAGTIVVTEGHPGETAYLVASGRVEVTTHDAHVAELGPGDVFGEIALLRDVPRTATVTALEPALLYTVEREDFLAAVTGHAPTSAGAGAVVTARLEQLRSI